MNIERTGKNVVLLSPPEDVQEKVSSISPRYIAKNISELLPLIRQAVFKWGQSRYTAALAAGRPKMNFALKTPWTTPDMVTVTSAVRSFGLDLTIWNCAPALRSATSEYLRDGAIQARKLCGCEENIRNEKRLILIEDRRKMSNTTRIHQNRFIPNMKEILQELARSFGRVSRVSIIFLL